MKTSLALGLSGFSLIAVTYGMARFAWGLMLPQVVSDIPFSPRAAGIISACSFAAYCVAILLASPLTTRFGPRWLAAVATGCAVLGLITLAMASSPLWLAVGLFIAGLSPGLASPALAAAVSLSLNESQQPRMNTLINAGTSAGIMLSVPVLFFMPGGWRAACLVFALLAVGCLWPLFRAVPRHLKPARPQGGCTLRQRPMLRLMLIACISGAASATWWSFGADILHHHVGLPQQSINLLWLICGAAGIVGALTGPLAGKIGMNNVYRLSLLFMALPLILLAYSHGLSGWLFVAVAMSGAGYVTLSGVLLVYGAEATPQAPASGVAAVFFMLAAGQVVGSMLFGWLSGYGGAVMALLAFAATALLMVCLLPGGSATRPGHKKGRE